MKMQNNMQHFYKNIQGWFRFHDIYKFMVDNAVDGSHFVEIGAWLGQSTSFMAVEIINSGKNIRFDVIDSFEGSQEHYERKYKEVINKTLYDDFLKNTEPVKDYINVIKGFSADIAKTYDDNSLDFVFIDASHDYDNVKADILAWLPKVKKGGIIAGDDYNSYWGGVVMAVNEIFTKIKFFGNNNIWYYEK